MKNRVYLLLGAIAMLVSTLGAPRKW
jgi:hypothetical protein